MTTPIIAVQYCPFCGEKLTISDVFRFCPYCGKKIHEKKHKDKHKVKRKLAKQEVSVAIPDLSFNPEVPEATAALLSAADENCTLVLKYCPNKEELFRKLTGLLQRERFAVRLAIDMTPAILMYKSHWVDVLPVMTACQSVGALFSVIRGEVVSHDPFPDSLLRELAESEQDLIKKSPPALWLGETLYCVVGQVESKAKRGVLILSNHYLYFVFNDSQHITYEMTPLDQMIHIECAQRREFTILVIRRKGQETEDLYATAQQQKITALQHVLQTAATAWTEQQATL